MESEEEQNSENDQNRPNQGVDANLIEGAGINYAVVEGSKPGTKLVRFKGHHYRIRGSRPDKEKTYLVCRHSTKRKVGKPCPAKAKIHRRVCYPKEEVQRPHNCGDAVASADSDAHELATVMKKRAVSERTPLSVSLF